MSTILARAHNVRPYIEIELQFSHHTCARGLQFSYQKGGGGCRAHLTLGHILGGVDKEASLWVEEELVGFRC